MSLTSPIGSDPPLIHVSASRTVGRGPALPRAMHICHATTMNGEIVVTGCWNFEEGSDMEDMERYRSCFAYRNAAWVEVAGPGGPVVQNSPEEPTSSFVAGCELVLLG